jgi:hypothetical protein
MVLDLAMAAVEHFKIDARVMLKFRASALFLFILCFLAVVFDGHASADNAAFDLAGPRIDIRVERGGKGLPIGQVPNLMPDDRLWIHADFPETQSARYLLIVVFLRGSTNPPPEKWFTRIETWTKPVRQEGVMVTVPQEAQQALLFLAPETGGDFSTLRATVRGKPGAFVRAAQDLEQASLDRARLEKYLTLLREASREDSGDLQKRTNLLARSLSIKVDQACFDKPSAQQLECLTQNSDQLVLDDAHSQSMVSLLASGSSADLVAQITNTPHMGGGAYSPYVGAIIDVARILGSAHTAKYQYIPALALPSGETLNLKLNNPPSFRDPKSVIVVGLPPIGHSASPPLRPVDAKQVFCAEHPALVLPAEGAPLVFGSELGHDFTFDIESAAGKTIKLPAKADAALGGFAVDSNGLKATELPENPSAKLHGFWGFEAVDGPAYQLRSSHPADWKVAESDSTALVVGREDTLEVHSEQAACVESVSVKDSAGKTLATDWKLAAPDALQLKIALQDSTPGALRLELKKYGAGRPDVVELHSYSEAAHLSGFSIHAGDSAGALTGSRLDQVAGLDLDGIHFSPGELSRVNQQDVLKMTAAAPESTAKLQQQKDVDAKVSLKDGRALNVSAAIEAPRPSAVLLDKSADRQGGTASTIKLNSPDEMPQDETLHFALKSEAPQKFTPDEKIEVATAGETFRAELTFASGKLTLQDPQTVLAVLDPLKELGPSGFGPLKFRPVDASGVAGDWRPLITVVRVPTLTEIRCTAAPEKQCTLNGDKLFLLDAVSVDPQFSQFVQVPEGFMNSSLSIPPVAGKTLYVKLRDNPAVVSEATVPVLTAPASSDAQQVSRGSD